jgi:hypothetical protein
MYYTFLCTVPDSALMSPVLLFVTAQYEIQKLVWPSRLKPLSQPAASIFRVISSGKESWDTMKTEATIMMPRRDVNYHERRGCKLFWNAGNYLPGKMATYPSIPESSSLICDMSFHLHIKILNRQLLSKGHRHGNQSCVYVVTVAPLYHSWWSIQVMFHQKLHVQWLVV